MGLFLKEVGSKKLKKTTNLNFNGNFVKISIKTKFLIRVYERPRKFSLL